MCPKVDLFSVERKLVCQSSERFLFSSYRQLGAYVGRVMVGHLLLHCKFSYVMCNYVFWTVWSSLSDAVDSG